jgi:eukaryotic-like serine/threonine-protein kinase
MISQTLGHYRMLEKIGEGGMGVVYRAHDERLERDVAVKVLTPGRLTDAAARKRFRSEALALSRLNHPNVATVYDFDTHDETDFLVMEYIPGESLNEKLAQGPLPEKDIIRWGCQLAEALAAAHDQGIIHRDLKPGNLRIRPDGKLKVLDFGLAKMLILAPGDELAQTLTKTHEGGGTLLYMAPEQMSGKPTDARTDIYAVGLVFYEMATGKPPFRANNALQLIDSILHHSPVPPGSVNRLISLGLESIIVKAMDRQPRLRYQSARELLVDLERLGAGTAPKAALNVHRRTPIRRLSLAVIPFFNVTKDPEIEFLCDGITESLIYRLSLQPRLRLMARTTVFRFKGPDVDPLEAGRSLGVRAVLTGKLAQRASGLNVQVELVNVADGSLLWGERYDCNPTDILNMQDEISAEITKKLLLRLTRKEQQALAKRYTEDTEAYQLYLRGRYYSDRWTEDVMERGIPYYNQAIEHDPGYALAYTGMAEAYCGMSSQFMSPREAMPKVREAAMKALAIDETLSDAHAMLAVVRAFYEHDWAGAEAEFTRALGLNFGSASAHEWYGYYLTAIGSEGEALKELAISQELDPLSNKINLVLGLSYAMARRYEKAIEQLGKTIKMDPDFWLGHLWLGWTFEQTGKRDQALEELNKAFTLGASPYASAYLGYVQALAGRKADAEKLVHDMEEQFKQRYVSPHHIAIVYVGLGEKDQAFEWLEKAYEHREEILVFLNVDPTWDSLRSDPRFQDLVRRIGLPQLSAIPRAPQTRGESRARSEGH